MSTQSGIKPSAELTSAFADASGSSSSTTTRAFSIKIESESMVVAESKPAHGDWESDWNSSVTPLLDDKAPRFVLYRLDSRSKVGWEWVVLEWIPDGAKVRDKMLYASSKATLTKTLGAAQFTDSVYATQAAELTLDAYKKHLVSKTTDAPLSETEKMLAQVKMEELQAEAIMQRRTPIPSARVSTPMDPDAMAVVARFDKDGEKLGLAVFTVDGETIKVDGAPVEQTVAPGSVSDHVPSNEPRFLLYRYKPRKSESSSDGHVVFVYSCPPSSKIKQKMVYSSSKAGFLNYIEKDVGITLARKYEVDGPREITDDLIEPDLASAASAAKSGSASAAAAATKLAFKRPVAPGRPRSAAANDETPSSSGGGGNVSSRIAAFERKDSESKAPAPKPLNMVKKESKPEPAAASPVEASPVKETEEAAEPSPSTPAAGSPMEEVIAEASKEEEAAPAAAAPSKAENKDKEDEEAAVKDDEWD